MQLAMAIVTEVLGTVALKASDGFSRPVPSLFVIAGYGASFFFLARTLGAIPMGFAYAIWSGAGTALIALIGVAFFRQRLDFPAIVGIVLIMAGVCVLNLFSEGGSASS